MSDNFGTLEFPVSPPAGDEAIHDSTLSKIGAYLAVCLNDALATSWKTVNPSATFVKTVQTNSPDDSTFNTKELPALYLWRTAINLDQVTDDWTEAVSDVTLLWVPQDAVQAKRSLRAPGVNGFAKVVARALELGRHPGWVDSGDQDPQAKTLGSVLIERCNLFRWPFLTLCKYDTLEIPKGSETASYPAFTANLRISEITNWDESYDSIVGADRAASKLDETVTQGPGFNIESLLPVH